MSAEAMTWAWEQIAALGPIPAFVTLLRVADNADFNGEYQTEKAALAAAMGVEERTVQRHIRRLEDDGLISRIEYRDEDGAQIANGYRVAMTPRTDLAGGDRSVPPLVVVSTSQGKTNGGQPERLDLQLEDAQASPTTRPPRAKIGGAAIDQAEWDLANAIIDAFNEAKGSKPPLQLTGKHRRPTEHLKKIVGRIREYPELTADEHRRIIANNFAAPWWDGPPGGVGVIYSPGAWPRAMVNDGKRRPKGRRTFAGERTTAKDDGPW